jgi:hypothetical protein
MIERDGAESGLGVGPGNLRIPQLVDDAITAMRQMGMSLSHSFSKMDIKSSKTCLLKASSARMATFDGSIRLPKH